MAKILFIDPSEVKKKCNIDGNTDDDKIVSSIEVAQDKHLANYLGDYLLRTLQGKMATIDDAGNAAYKTLWLTYVKPVLIWFTVENYLPWAMFKISNGGVYKSLSETSQAVSMSEMKLLLHDARENAEIYTRKMIDYIEANQSSFPEFFTTESTADRHPDRDETQSIGWVL